MGDSLHSSKLVYSEKSSSCKIMRGKQFLVSRTIMVGTDLIGTMPLKRSIVKPMLKSENNRVGQ